MKLEGTDEETQRAVDDLWTTHGKKGTPELPAQPDPETEKIREESAPARRPGRPRGSKTKRSTSTGAETSIVYATKDRTQCGGQIVAGARNHAGQYITVNNGLGFISIPVSEEGKSWVRLTVFNKSKGLGAPIQLAPATIRAPGVLPENGAAPAKKCQPRSAGPLPTPKPPVLPDFAWRILDMRITDMEKAATDKDLPEVRRIHDDMVRIMELLPENRDLNPTDRGEV